MDGLVKSPAIAAREVHHRAKILAVHDSEKRFWLVRKRDLLGAHHAVAPREMAVEVDHRVAGARNLRLLNMEHALRLVLRKRQRRALRRESGTGHSECL